ncbi:glycosyl hydrolase [candidate division KSB1 bacterium]|nr:glycosyl hydrolase [candidate division KSB1 bacterium]
MMHNWIKIFQIMLLTIVISCASQNDELEQSFKNPPTSARPGVYWYFMDGNLDREGMTADLEAMKAAGIGNLIFLEVNVGVPSGPVDFLSEEWQELFTHAVHEAERLGIEITLGSGPGWTGSGGPWVKPEQSMQHLVASTVTVLGPSQFQGTLPIPEPRRPFFNTLTPELIKERADYYEDIAVLAFSIPTDTQKIADIDEKALYYRSPYSSVAGVKAFLPALSNYPEKMVSSAIAIDKIIDLTTQLNNDGTLSWEVPEGNWTIMRFGRRNNGANTRPAPFPGLGFECDKFDTAALDAHFQEYVGKLLKKVGPRKKGVGWTMLHIDSWEMGAQNWTANFRKEFQRRRGYDPLPFYPAYTGLIVESLELTERFLWDLRKTAQELVIENHAARLKELGRQYGLGLSIEPYDMNPTADLTLGLLADVPMCEFWSKGFGFETSFSCIEAASIAHTMGRPVVAAEAFTAGSEEAMKQYPGSMKNQTDWAFCVGINRLVFHTFAHQPLGNEKPGMTMGPYGVHWHRNQTWWPMVSAYHQYVSRCSHLLQQGTTVADILYLTPEGAPHVFRAPKSALAGSDTLPDRKGYNFDGCSPEALMEKAEVRNGLIVFPGGSSYRLLILPAFDTMTPALLNRIKLIVEQGATVIGKPSIKSPSLTNYPDCDQEILESAALLWGRLEATEKLTERHVGKGRLFWGGELMATGTELYPDYNATVSLLKQMEIPANFESTGPIRYTHRETNDRDIYFVANSSAELIDCICKFRIEQGIPELWNPLTGNIRQLPEFSYEPGRTIVPLRFEPYQSFFVIFRKNNVLKASAVASEQNFPPMQLLKSLEGTWNVKFDPKFGGPGEVVFKKLEDWTVQPEPGIKYYSGIASYTKIFDLDSIPNNGSQVFFILGEIHDMAQITLNGQDLGVVWCAPWRVDITKAIKVKDNHLEIKVANRWANRLIGDQQVDDKNVREVQWSSGLLDGKKYMTGRYTFSTFQYYKADSYLLPSGLMGPVKILSIK